MSVAIDISDIELYGFLGLQKFASDEEIKKAYRKLALKLHPDKNPDKNAAEKFQKLQKVYEALTDITKKGEYDRKIKAKQEVEKRLKEMDAQTQYFKRKFDEREKAYQEAKKEKDRQEKEKEALIQRMREEGRRKLREEELEKERKSKQAQKEKQAAEEFKIVVSWKVDKKDKEPAYESVEIQEIFSKFGEIKFFVKSPKKEGLYMIVYGDRYSAILAKTAVGKPSHPLKVKPSFDDGPAEEQPEKSPEVKSNRHTDTLEDILRRYNVTTRDSAHEQPKEAKRARLEDVDAETGLPIKYVYAHGTDTVFACAATFALPEEMLVDLREEGEVVHDGYLVRLYPNERDKYAYRDD